ncbi:MAG: hypothetical protein HY428_02215, partial [Candidatus Levybacteria bacterium]|nr:hypothetical protein [Candidatus Levybacteria bacterium]
MLEILPPELLRFLMVKTKLNQAINFDPAGDTIPDLFDDYQQAALAYKNKSDEDLARAFEYSQIGKEVKLPPFGARFINLAQWVQMPNAEQKIKEYDMEEWVPYAKIWVERFAPDSAKYELKKDIPESAKKLTGKQKEFLKKVATEIDKDWNAEEFQKQIYDWAKDFSLSSHEAFEAIYISLLDKTYGPKAAWLILFNKDFVKLRFEEIYSSSERSEFRSGNSSPQGRTIISLNKPNVFSIDNAVKEKYPSISIGIAIIKGVTIEETNPQLEREKEAFLKSLAGLTTEQLGQYPEIQAYRRLYKEMGVDWHSRRPSPEALLRRVALKKGLYTVNTCVDAYNLVVMKHRISVGAFDLDKIDFPTVLRFPEKGEEILLLGDSEPTVYKETELAYFDRKGGYNIDFNFRDAKRTAVQLKTKNLYLNIDGVYDITSSQVEQALREACDIIMKHCGGRLETFGVDTAS